MRWKKTEYRLVVLVAMTVILSSTNLCVAQTKDKINVKVDYVAKLNELAKAGRQENLNAARYYEKAFGLAVERPERLKKLNYKIWPADLSAEQQAMLQAWVQQNSEAVAQLKKGTQKPYYWTEYQGVSLWDVRRPGEQIRLLYIAICSRAKLNAAEGGLEEAFSDLVACYRFGTHFTAFAGPKDIFEQMAGLATMSIATNAAFQILDKKKPACDLLSDFQENLQKSLSHETFTFDFTAEKLKIYETIQGIFTDNAKGGGHMPKAEVENLVNIIGSLQELSQRERQELRGKLEKLNRQQTTELANRIYEYFGTAAKKTPAHLRREGEDVQQVIEEMTRDNPFLFMFMPAAGRLVEVSFRVEVETSALIATMAVLRHKADTGQYPENLEELASAGYLKSLPMDPYSEKPLVYKRTKIDFMLYSFGADFDDDGGVPSKWGEGEKGGDQVFWPVERPNAKQTRLTKRALRVK
jgi:hypothetical protein